MAFTFSCGAVSRVLDYVTADQKHVWFEDGFRLPVVDTVDSLHATSSPVNRDTGCCLCRKEHFILMWETCSSGLLAEASRLHDRINRVVSLQQMSVGLY